MENKQLTQEKSVKISLESILKCRITDQTEIKPLEPIITINDSVFCATNELSFISGKPKAGKTSVASIILSTCLTQYPTFDTLGIKGTYKPDQEIIYIDSEQSKRSSYRILERIKKNLGRQDVPENLHVYNFRHYGNEELKQAFELLLKHHPKAYLWFLDGIADMVTSVNNEQEAKSLIHFLNSQVEKNETAFILFLHENSQSQNDKMRGHLGSEAQRKCFATISISKDTKLQTHFIKSVETREGRNFEEIAFRFDEQSKSMVLLSHKEKIEAKNSTREDLWELALHIFGNDTTQKVRMKDAKSRLMDKMKISEKTARNKIQELIDSKMVEIEEKSKSESYLFLYNLPSLPIP